MPIRLLADVSIQTGDGAALQRWRVNAGSEMIVTVAGVNDGPRGPRPIRAVLDLSGVKLPTGRLIALADHDEKRPVGFWDNFQADGSGLYACPHLAKAENEMEAAALQDAVRLSALIRNGVPIQASVGVEPGPSGSWELVPSGESITLNGRTYSGDGELPLFVLRGAELFETSIVTFGADSETGRVAARKETIPAKETAMAETPLKSLLAKFDQRHHGLVARCVAEGEDDTKIAEKIHAADMADKDAQITKLQAGVDKLRGFLDQQGYMVADDYSVSPAEKKEERQAVQHNAATASRGAARGVTFAANDGGKKQDAEPETLWSAMKLLGAKRPELKGFKLRAEAKRIYPNLPEC